MNSKTFYCPIYDGNISEYDCAKISCGAKMGYYFNDGLLPLVPLEAAKSNEERYFEKSIRKASPYLLA